MPNWCENTLAVTGDGSPEGDKQYVDFRDKFLASGADGEYKLAQTFLPVPAELEQDLTLYAEPVEALVEKYGTDNAYNWAIMNWGVKWGDCHTEEPVVFEKSLQVSFDTPWDVMHKFFDKVSQDFPNLIFTLEFWLEGGEGAGTIAWHGNSQNIDTFLPTQEEAEEHFDKSYPL